MDKRLDPNGTQRMALMAFRHAHSQDRLVDGKKEKKMGTNDPTLLQRKNNSGKTGEKQSCSVYPDGISACAFPAQKSACVVPRDHRSFTGRSAPALIAIRDRIREPGREVPVGRARRSAREDEARSDREHEALPQRLDPVPCLWEDSPPHPFFRVRNELEQVTQGRRARTTETHATSRYELIPHTPVERPHG